MVDDPNLVGFGWVILVSCIVVIVTLRHAPQKPRLGTNPEIAPPDPDQANQLDELTQAYWRLQQELQHQQRHLTATERQKIFTQLQTLLTSFPSARHMVQVKPDLPAKNVISLFTPLETLLRDWGYEPIGSPWDRVTYDPQLHQPDVVDLRPGEAVYIRFVGYRQGDRILCPAKVSRSLPGGIL
jgi:molecular chaperone GrpE (heat shock protein)